MSKYFANKNDLLDSPVNIVVIIIAVVLFLIAIVLSGIIQDNWGINQAHYLSPVLYYIWLVLSLGVLVLLFVVPPRHYLSDLLAPYFWGEKKLIGRIVFIVLAFLIFVLLRFDAQLYGNGYIRISNFSQRTIPIFRWYEYGGTLLPYLIFLIIHSFVADIVRSALYAYQALSLWSGIVFIIFTFRISEIIGEKNEDRLAVFLMTMLSGLTLFFFGMVENAPLILAFFAIFIYYMLILNRDRKKVHVLYSWIIFVIGLIFDIRFITVLPAVAYLNFIYLIKRNKIGSFLGYLAAFISIFIGLAVLYLKAVDNLALQNAILFFTGKSPDVNYSILSGRHLLDIFNLFYLIIPLFPVFLFAIIRGFSAFKTDINFRSFGLITIAQIIYIFIIDPKIGMARDINIYAPLLVGFVLLGIYALLLLKRDFDFSQNIFMALSPVALLLIVPMFIVHLAPQKSMDYLDDYLTYNENKYEAALYAFRDYYIVEGKDSLAVLRERAITAKAPGVLESHLVDDLYAHDRVDEAFEYALRLVDRYPYNAVYHMQKGNLLKYYKKPNDAEKEYKTALQLDPYLIDAYHFLAQLYDELNMKSKSYEVLQQALKIDPENKEILTDLAVFYYKARDYQATDSLCDLVIALDTDEAYPYMFKGLVAEANKHYEQAMKYYEKFITLGDKLPDITLVRKRLNELFLKTQDSTAGE